MFNRKEREELNSLSMELFGSSSRWQKMISNESFRVTVGEKEVPGSQQYIRFQRSRKDPRPGTMMKVEKAIALGRVKDDIELGVKKLQVRRIPTFVELKTALEANLEMVLMSQMTPEELSCVLAHDLVANRLQYAFALSVSPETKDEEIQTLIEKCPENLRDTLKNSIKTADNDLKGVQLDALTFLSDVIFCVNHKDASRELYENSFLSAKEKRKKK